ncbi:MAG: ABC transporter ATP-binding protein [Gemmatimonadota bacterium]
MIFESESLVVRFARGRPPALDGVSMRVPSGSLYGVLGPNGSGKSTLMRALLGSVEVESGRADVDGTPARDWNRRELARAVGVVTQSEGIAFPIRVRDLVGMGRYPHLGAFEPEGAEDRRAIEAALRECDVEMLADREVSTLSGGEFQRVRIARAMAQRPRALVLDEPTASLDIRHEMAILKLLRRSADAGLTVLLITHNINLAARFSDRLLLLREGRVAAEGTAGEVLREEILEAVYRWPLAVQPDPVTGEPTVTPLGD